MYTANRDSELDPWPARTRGKFRRDVSNNIPYGVRRGCKENVRSVVGSAALYNVVPVYNIYVLREARYPVLSERIHVKVVERS